MRKSLTRRIPAELHQRIRLSLYAVVDAFDYLLGRRDNLTPPKRMMYCGGNAYKETGRAFFEHLVELGGVESTDRVLDLGCGLGRVALPLAEYLVHETTYDGVDIVEKAIRWCRRQITARYPNFRFHHADLYNKFYNPKGGTTAAEYTFPFDDGAFDFVFLTSVFTHMLPDGIDNYFREIGRVLRPGGRCFATYFLLNDESRSLMGTSASTRDFRHDVGGCHTTDKRTPETAVAYGEKDIRRRYRAHGFELLEPVYYGSWCGRTGTVTYQDIVVARKRPGDEACG